MRYAEELEKEVRKYCRDNNVVNPNLIKGIVHYFNKKHRTETRNLELGKSLDTSIEFQTIVRNIEKTKCESPIEEYLFKAMRQFGIDDHFTQQHQIGKYRVDFACEEKRVVVECDGKEYHFLDKMQIERDQKRDKYLSRKGWIVLHFDGLMIRRNIHAVIGKIRTYVDA